jgi:hypothetical protein
MIDTELIRKARNTDLLDYLHLQGYQLIKSSAREYRLLEHDSLVISNNRWNWFSRDIGGNTLDFLVKYEGKSFNEAVGILTGTDLETSVGKTRDIFITIPAVHERQTKTVDFMLPPKAKDYHRVFAYLNKTRKIDSAIIADMMHQEKIYQSDRNNCVFIGMDKDGTIRFACERGTFTGISYRRDCPGSDKRFGFHMEGRSNLMYVFEAPIDAMSHATIFKMQKFDYMEDHRISLGCLGDAAMIQYLQDRSDIKNIILCLDNDQWGRAASAKFMRELKEKGYTVSEEFSKQKDYNEDLIQIIKAKPMSMTR